MLEVKVDELLAGRPAGGASTKLGCEAFVGLGGKVAVVVESVGMADELLVDIWPGRRRGGGRAGCGVSWVTFRENDCERSPKLPRTLPSTLCLGPRRGLSGRLLSQPR
jgi:hypothetical protein